MTILVFFGSFFLLLFLSVPVSFSLLLSTVICLVTGLAKVPLLLIPSNMYTVTDSFSLFAIPFFILAGNLMVSGGIAKRLVNLFYSLVHWITGGLAIVSTMTCMFFAALSGSSAATAAAIGKTLIPQMEEYGYDRGYSGAIVASGGIIGMIIPPSIAMVVYAQSAEVSVEKLFLTGFLPGIMAGVGMMIISYYFAKKNGYKNSGRKLDLKEVGRTFIKAFWALTVPFMVLGSIYAGICTATEAAAVSVFYAMLIGKFMYRELTLESIKRALMNTFTESAIILFLMCSASVFSWFIVNQKIPQIIANAMLQLSDSRIIIMLLIMVLYLIAGCLANPSTCIVLLTPILLPVITTFGVDLIYFGLFTVFTLGIGMITPPVGADLFVVVGIAHVTFERLVRCIIPFIILLTLLSVLYILFPGIVMWLPNLLS